MERVPTKAKYCIKAAAKAKPLSHIPQLLVW